jgi:alpha-beta hydrolase superfamily lysophospholipase
MIPVAARIARSARGRLAVYRLLNSSRGWDTHHTPVDDVRWALEEVSERYPDLPAGLVGHSLGARAALLAGGAPGVRGVVALNPWVYPDDDVDLRGRRVLVVHGTDDRIASPARSRVVADRLAGRAESLDYLSVEGGKHAMLRHAAAFERPAAEFTRKTLLGPR